MVWDLTYKQMLLAFLLDGADLALVQPRWQLEFEALMVLCKRSRSN